MMFILRELVKFTHVNSVDPTMRTMGNIYLIEVIPDAPRPSANP